jgi:hypothetical protein
LVSTQNQELSIIEVVPVTEDPMPTAKKKTRRGRKQDRARVAGGQNYEVRYTAKKTRKSAGAVKKAVKKVGSRRKAVVKALTGKKR